MVRKADEVVWSCAEEEVAIVDQRKKMNSVKRRYNVEFFEAVEDKESCNPFIYRW